MKARSNIEQGLVGMMVALAFAGMAMSARGGNSLNSPAAPTNPASAMWTLENIYNELDTRTTNVTLRPGGFAEPTAGPTNGTMRTLNEIMALVTNRAPAMKTGQTNSFYDYDDGWYSTNLGVAWPTPRFSKVAESGDQTNQIRDNLTGLIWARNANLASNTTWATGWSSVKGTCTWYQAFDVITNSAGPVNGQSYGGANDWRMPNERELRSLISYGFSSLALCNAAGTAKWTEGDPFTGVQAAIYWSSTPDSGNQFNAVMCVDLNSGSVYSSSGTTAKTSMYYVWPVRGGGQ